MARRIGGRFVPDRQRRGAPEMSSLLIPKIESLARLISDWIVGPRRQLMLAAVHGPGVTAAFRGHQETEGRIGDHVDPRHWRRLARAEDRHVVAAALGEATEAIEELHARRPSRDLKLGSGQSALCCDPGQRPGFGRALKLIDEPSARSDQDNTRDGRKKAQGLRRGQVGAQHEGVPGWPIFVQSGAGTGWPSPGSPARSGDPEHRRRRAR